MMKLNRFLDLEEVFEVILKKKANNGIVYNKDIEKIMSEKFNVSSTEYINFIHWKTFVDFLVSGDDNDNDEKD